MQIAWWREKFITNFVGFDFFFFQALVIIGQLMVKLYIMLYTNVVEFFIEIY